MSEEFTVLGTQLKGEDLEVEECILPLVVLFSIAAQGNRAAGPRVNRPFRPNYPRYPIYQGVGMYPRTGRPYGSNGAFAPPQPGIVLPGVPGSVRRRGI